MIRSEGQPPAGESSAHRTPDREDVQVLFHGYADALHSYGQAQKKVDGWLGDVFAWATRMDNQYYTHADTLGVGAKKTNVHFYSFEPNEVYVDVGMHAGTGERVVLYLTPDSANWIYPNEQPDMGYDIVFDMHASAGERMRRRPPTQEDIEKYKRVLLLIQEKHQSPDTSSR